MHYRALGAEGLGSMLLAATVIGSGVMAERLAGGAAPEAPAETHPGGTLPAGISGCMGLEV